MSKTEFRERLIVKQGDITEESVDAIVNAANTTLLGGGGVDGAIHAKGGAAILRACEDIRKTRFPGGLPTGQAVITTAGNLPAKFVIHTVGPIYGRHDGNEPTLLADCYKNSIALAVENNLTSIAFPAISTGVYGYPKAEADRIAFTIVEKMLEKYRQIRVSLVFFSARDQEIFLRSTQA